MAFIRKRGSSIAVVYKYKDEKGKEYQKSETFDTMEEAEIRRKEIEYKMAVGNFQVPKCTRVGRTDQMNMWNYMDMMRGAFRLMKEIFL